VQLWDFSLVLVQSMRWRLLQLLSTWRSGASAHKLQLWLPTPQWLLAGFCLSMLQMTAG
jgi:hypothetical protein